MAAVEESTLHLNFNEEDLEAKIMDTDSSLLK